MIVPNPAVLQQAVDRYLALAADGDMAVTAPLQNAAYTLCVLSGTRTVEEAMAAVRLMHSPSTAPSPTSRRQTFTVSSGETSPDERELVS
ncbi:DUF5133 domain-containing protein [Streptomyces sp. NPDC058469]|uniref:DUF5133 domain-containing protein n=1 Tax=Streptomyces sp. NPDC058469 TaxID=3346514 RepID=UPI00365CF9F1